VGKKIAIIQSNYIPWKGYFDIINAVDEFIIYDDVQYTKNDWRNRNKVKANNGAQWLAIPVNHNLSLKIKEIKVVNNLWRRKHWNTLIANYTKAACFKDYKDRFEALYLGGKEEFLSEINYAFFKEINALLKIRTKLSWVWDYNSEGDRIERLINLCKQTDADEYLSGPSARGYIDETVFRKNNIKISWMDYDNYPVYNQLYPPFEHGVSILDLIFNEGENAPLYMKSYTH